MRSRLLGLGKRTKNFSSMKTTNSTKAIAGHFHVPVAVFYGLVCHTLFCLAIASIVIVMGSGMTLSFGSAPYPLSWLINTVLLLQFPIAHSLLLSDRGRKWFRYLAPPDFARDLAPTIYVIIASAQISLLFMVWTSSGVIWWQATGWAFYGMLIPYAAAWVLLAISIVNAGVGLQSGFNGWWAVLRNRPVAYPDLPTRGLFRLTRHPIYVSFALTTWTVPVWTPDQLVVAIVFTGYCVLGPLHKEHRLHKLYKDRFEQYARKVPYWLPIKFRKRKLEV